MRFIFTVIAVLALALSPYAAMAISRQQIAERSAQGIQGVTMETTLVFEGGFQVELTMHGVPGAQGAIRIDRGHKLYAREVSPGIYKVRCMRSAGARMTSVPVTGYLVPPDGIMLSRHFRVSEAIQVAMFQTGEDPRIQVVASQSADDSDLPSSTMDPGTAEDTEPAPVVKATTAPVAAEPAARVSVPETTPSTTASAAPVPAATFTPNLPPGPGVLNNDTIDEMRRYYNDPVDPAPPADATAQQPAAGTEPVAGEVSREPHEKKGMPSGIVVGERHELQPPAPSASPEADAPAAIPTTPAGYDTLSMPGTPPAPAAPAANNNAAAYPPIYVNPPPIVPPSRH